MTVPLSEDTRTRLLMAAGEVFAERGFKSATVRQICSRAGVNIAAVNYHFKGKDGLYRAVIKYIRDTVFVKYPITPGLPDAAPAEERLRAFALNFLMRLLDKGQPSWHARLMVREIMDPTSALDGIVEEFARPVFKYLSSIMSELLGPDADQETLRFMCLGVVGQCMYFYIGRPVFSRLFKDIKYDIMEIEGFADHIARKTVLAARGMSS